MFHICKISHLIYLKKNSYNLEEILNYICYFVRRNIEPLFYSLYALFIEEKLLNYQQNNFNFLGKNISLVLRKHRLGDWLSIKILNYYPFFSVFFCFEGYIQTK